MLYVFHQRVVVGALEILFQGGISRRTVKLGLENLGCLGKPDGIPVGRCVDKALAVGNLHGIGGAVRRRCRLVLIGSPADSFDLLRRGQTACAVCDRHKF